MAKQIACGDVMAGCSFVATASTEDDLLQEVARHAQEVHGVTEITPEILAKVKSAVKDVEA